MHEIVVVKSPAGDPRVKWSTFIFIKLWNYLATSYAEKSRFNVLNYCLLIYVQ
jgi:hypothetical protein